MTEIKQLIYALNDATKPIDAGLRNRLIRELERHVPVEGEIARPYGTCAITGPAEDVSFVLRHLPDVDAPNLETTDTRWIGLAVKALRKSHDGYDHVIARELERSDLVRIAEMVMAIQGDCAADAPPYTSTINYGHPNHQRDPERYYTDGTEKENWPERRAIRRRNYVERALAMSMIPANEFESALEKAKESIGVLAKERVVTYEQMNTSIGRKRSRLIDDLG